MTNSLKRIKNKILLKTTFKKFPVLKTERLNLVQITTAHAGDILELFANEEVTRFYDLLPFKTVHESKNLIKLYHNRYLQDTGIRWGISLKGEKHLIGTIGFNCFSKNHRADIGYDLKPAYWGKGYMNEALIEVLQYGFKKLEINRIEAKVMLDNKRSKKLLYKLNFKKEGILKEWLLFNDKHHDMSMFALLRSDFNTKT